RMMKSTSEPLATARLSRRKRRTAAWKGEVDFPDFSSNSPNSAATARSSSSSSEGAGGATPPPAIASRVSSSRSSLSSPIPMLASLVPADARTIQRLRRGLDGHSTLLDYRRSTRRQSLLHLDARVKQPVDHVDD